MKTLTYDYEKMVRAGQILNSLSFCGVNSARLIAELGDILDSGKPGEIIEPGLKKGCDKNAMDSQKVCPNKLEKQTINSNGTGSHKS